MKKITALMLFLCLTVGLAASLSACKKQTQVDFSAGYQLVFEEGLNDTLKNCVTSFAADMEAALGIELTATVSAGGATEKLEILVGDTDRPESAELKKKIEGDGYAFGVRKDKLVLVGSNKLYTVMALNAFSALLAEANGSTLTVSETVCSNMSTVRLTEQYGVIYSSLLDETVQKDASQIDPEENPDCLSYAVVAAKNLRTSLRAILSAKSTSLPCGNDRKESYTKEVLVGTVNREETKDFLQHLDANAYGVSVTKNKVVVTGQNDAGLRHAVAALHDVIEVATTEVDGRKTILLPEGFSLILSFANRWETDFPRPTGEGVSLKGSIDAESNNLLFTYSGDKDDYLAYCQQLETAGYTLLQSNEAAGSIYRIYRNGKIRLHVSYTAYSAAFAQDVKEYTPGIRIVSSKEGGRGSDYDDSYLTQDLSSYTKLTNSRLTSVYPYYDAGTNIAGNCYFLQLEDGSFIVLDGTFSEGGAENRIYNALADLHRQATGSSPSTANPIVIAAWYLTHGHGDHYLSFVKMCKTYAGKIRVEALISNFPSDELCYNFSAANMTVRNDMSIVSGYTGNDLEYIKVHTGQRIYIRNLEIETIFTPEDLYPVAPEQFNDTNTVLRFIVHNTDGSGQKQGDPTTILWLGDSQPTSTRCMRAMWGEYLKSDAVQVAHHGGDSTEPGFYTLIQPEVVLWPCATRHMTIRVDNNSKPDSWQYQIYQLYRMDSVKYHIVADLYNTTITINEDGFVMSLDGKNALYNAGESERIVIGGLDDRHCAVIRK